MSDVHLGVYQGGSYSEIYIEYEGYYGGSWYPLYGGNLSGDNISFGWSTVDLYYPYNGYEYYWTSVFLGDMTMPTYE
jgi:hypothetical protein